MIKLRMIKWTGLVHYEAMKNAYKFLIRKAEVKSLGKSRQGRKINTEIDFGQRGA
jgi:hypothetical protein